MYETPSQRYVLLISAQMPADTVQQERGDEIQISPTRNFRQIVSIRRRLYLTGPAVGKARRLTCMSIDIHARCTSTEWRTA